MTPEQFKQLERGDIVRRVGAADSWLVEANYGNRVLIVRCQELSNPGEWDLIFKARHVRVCEANQAGVEPAEASAERVPKPAKKKRGSPIQCFDKLSFPKNGESWSYTNCYFSPGDAITWRPKCDRVSGGIRRGVVRTDKVEKIKRNQYGRISYYTERGDMVLLEEVMEAI